MIATRSIYVRVGAMFERWAAEDVSDEPEWDVDQVERITFLLASSGG